MGIVEYFSGKKEGGRNAGQDPILNCPRCQRKMIKKTKNAVTIDKCTNCGGIWLDKGEIFKIIHTLENEKGKKAN